MRLVNFSLSVSCEGLLGPQFSLVTTEWQALFSMSAMEEKLIEAVRDRNILYDTSHPDYMKIKIKLKIWDEIAKEIGMQSGKCV